MPLPSSNFVPDFLRRLLRDGWTETTKDPFPSICLPRSKREPQKIKLLVQVSLSSIGILAIDHFRLLRMQLQSTLLQPCRYFDTHQVRFPLCSAMNDDIVRVSLERQMRPISPHPEIERVVQKQIGQLGRNDSPNAKGNLRSALIQWRPRAASATRLSLAPLAESERMAKRNRVTSNQDFLHQQS